MKCAAFACDQLMLWNTNESMALCVLLWLACFPVAAGSSATVVSRLWAHDAWHREAAPNVAKSFWHFCMANPRYSVRGPRPEKFGSLTTPLVLTQNSFLGKSFSLFLHACWSCLFSRALKAIPKSTGGFYFDTKFRSFYRMFVWIDHTPKCSQFMNPTLLYWKVKKRINKVLFHEK